MPEDGLTQLQRDKVPLLLVLNEPKFQRYIYTGGARKRGVGDRVRAKCSGWTKYYDGEITSRNANGTYNIKFDDGERKRGIAAVSVASLPYSLNMHLWAEVRVNANGNIINRYLTIRDEYLRYQTTNQALFKDLFTLAPFLPTTNAILLGADSTGKLAPGPRASLVPLRADNEPYRNWLNWTNITQAGYVDKLHTNRFQRTWEIFPDRFVKQILIILLQIKTSFDTLAHYSN